MYKPGYKFVRRTASGKLVSALPDCDTGTVEYVRGVATVPNKECGPLCVFNTKRNALSWGLRLNSAPFELWHCEYLPSRPVNGEIFTAHPARRPVERRFLAKGTVLAHQVILTEPVVLKGFKIVRKDEGMLLSGSFLTGAVEYARGKEVFPISGNGPLCVYKTRERAVASLAAWPKHGDVTLWECDYVPAFGIESVWRSCGDGRRLVARARDLHHGTGLAFSVTLTERVA